MKLNSPIDPDYDSESVDASQISMKFSKSHKFQITTPRVVGVTARLPLAFCGAVWDPILGTNFDPPCGG